MLAVTDQRIPNPCRSALEARGFEVVALPPFSALDPRVASHPDMLILPLGDRLFVHRSYHKENTATICRIAEQAHLSLSLIDDEVRAEYPKDVTLNVAVVGNRLIGKTDAVSHQVLTYALQRRMTFKSVKQGYAKCSSVTLGSHAVITADRSIATACASLSIDVLEIKSGSVLLDGYGCGFLGGASGVCQSTVFFCGDLLQHPDGDKIAAFCQKHGFEAVSLSQEPLYDVGTIFFF